MKKPLIIFDPGHGGRDTGATRNGVHEKKIVLDISLQLRDILQRAGFEVAMTRESDKHFGVTVNADLTERVRLCNEYTRKAQAEGRPVFVLSIHINAFTPDKGHGSEIYVNGTGGDIRPLAQMLVDGVAKVGSIGYHGQPIKSSSQTPHGGLAMTDRTDAPAALIELFFIDSDDLQKAQANMNEFAPAMARALCKFYGLPYPDDKPAAYNHAKALAEGVAAKGIIASPETWEKVLRGEIVPKREWLQGLFENIVKLG